MIEILRISNKYNDYLYSLSLEEKGYILESLLKLNEWLEIKKDNKFSMMLNLIFIDNEIMSKRANNNKAKKKWKVYKIDTTVYNKEIDKEILLEYRRNSIMTKIIEILSNNEFLFNIDNDYIIKYYDYIADEWNKLNITPQLCIERLELFNNRLNKNKHIKLKNLNETTLKFLIWKK